MPTILEALGHSIPEGTDGLSYLPLFEGNRQPDRDSLVTVFYNAYPVAGGKKPELTTWYEMRTIHKGDYAYIYNGWAQGERWFTPLSTPEILKEMEETGHEERVEFFRKRSIEELYDFEADPDGLNNLADQPGYQPLVREMRAQLLEWMKQYNDTDLLPEYEVLVRDGGITSTTPFGKGYLK
jgi:N-sulfoglucosamine sulfohydrolase